MAESTAFKTTKINAKTFEGGQEDKDKIELGFLDLEASKTDAVLAERNGAIETAKAAIARQRVTISTMELLKKAAFFDPRIAAENQWIVYKNKDGDIIFEGITERIQRNAVRAQLHNIGQNQQEFPSDKDMYEEGDVQE